MKKAAPEAATVLERIAESTRRRVARQKARTPEPVLRAMLSAAREPRDFAAGLAGPGLRVIAEVKLASPSAGTLSRELDPVKVALEYAANGAAAISVLTEPEFFSGKISYLVGIREKVELPLLMKDFILDEYQLLQARVYGADCALLIMAMLGPERLSELLRASEALGLSNLVEVHDAKEMKAALECGAKLIGVNNRDLKTLKVSLDVSRKLAPLGRKAKATLVCESGLTKRAELEELAGLGFGAFLIGTHFIRGGQPGAALAALLGRKPA